MLISLNKAHPFADALLIGFGVQLEIDRKLLVINQFCAVIAVAVESTLINLIEVNGDGVFIRQRNSYLGYAFIH